MIEREASEVSLRGFLFPSEFLPTFFVFGELVCSAKVPGNILTKKDYPYTNTTGTPGTPTKTYSYAYGDANWKDKLTSYDAKAITYDAIANPLTYDGWTYTWEAGRQLAGCYDEPKDIRQILQMIIERGAHLRLVDGILQVTIYSMDIPKYQRATEKLCRKLNELEPVTLDKTIFRFYTV